MASQHSPWVGASQGGQEFCFFVCGGASDTCSWYLFYTQLGLGRNHNLYYLKKSLFQEKALVRIQLALCLNMLLFPSNSSSSVHPHFLAQQHCQRTTVLSNSWTQHTKHHIVLRVMETGQLCCTLLAWEHDSHLLLQQVSAKPSSPAVQWSGG